MQSLVEIAKPQETQVHIIHVIDALSNQLPEMTVHYPGIEHERDSQLKPAEALVARMAALLRSKGFRVTTAVALGNVKSRILEAAATWPADLIVMGSHSRTGLERLFMGSLAESVARRASCSVEIVRIPKGAR